jgi:hypothetical protein
LVSVKHTKKGQSSLRSKLTDYNLFQDTALDTATRYMTHMY